jgi:hypothetical protein
MSANQNREFFGNPSLCLIDEYLTPLTMGQTSMETLVHRSILPFFLGVAATCYLLTEDQSFGQSMVQVWTGYYDLAPTTPPGVGSNLPLPNPWNGSSNTVFYSTNAAIYSPSDPDVNAIRLQNLGATAVTLSALNVGGTIDFFSSSYDNITGTVTLNPGTNYIFEGFDGSDLSYTSVVNLTLNSVSYSYSDATDPTFPNGVLSGFPINADETIPWTAIYTPVPESSTVPALLGSAALCIAAFVRCRTLRSSVGFKPS